MAAGYPKAIRVDQGSAFVSRDMDLWAYQRGVVLDFSRTGKPTDNAFIAAFNGWFRAECLNQHWFLTLADAVEKLEAWRRYYNKERPHGAIGNKVPILLTKSGASPARHPERSRETLPSGGPTLGSTSTLSSAAKELYRDDLETCDMRRAGRRNAENAFARTARLFPRTS